MSGNVGNISGKISFLIQYRNLSHTNDIYWVYGFILVFQSGILSGIFLA